MTCSWLPLPASLGGPQYRSDISNIDEKRITNLFRQTLRCPFLSQNFLIRFKTKHKIVHDIQPIICVVFSFRCTPEWNPWSTLTYKLTPKPTPSTKPKQCASLSQECSVTPCCKYLNFSQLVWNVLLC